MKHSKSIKKLLVTVLLIIAVAGISFIFWFDHSNWAEIALPENLRALSQQELSEDYDYLCDLIRSYNTPAAAEFSPEEQEAALQRGRETLTSDAENPVYAFAEALDGLFSELRPVSNIHALSSYEMDMYAAIFRNEGVVEDSKLPDLTAMLDDEDLMQSINWNTAWRILKANGIDLRNISLKEFAALRSISDSAPEKSEEAVEPESLSFAEPAAGIAYVRIPSFEEKYVSDDGEALSVWYRDSLDCEAIIFDLRNNAGGTDYYWLYNIVPYFLNEETSFSSYVFIKDFPKYFDREGFLERFKLCDDELKAELYNGLRAEESSAVADIELYERVNRVAFDEERCLDYGGELYILVNEKTANAAAAFAYFCRKTGFASVVGTETAADSGAGASLSSMVFMLPNSKLALTMKIGLAVNSEGNNDMKRGIIPDLLAGETDALQYCVDHIDDIRTQK